LAAAQHALVDLRSRDPDVVGTKLAEIALRPSMPAARPPALS